MFVFVYEDAWWLLGFVFGRFLPSSLGCIGSRLGSTSPVSYCLSFLNAAITGVSLHSRCYKHASEEARQISILLIIPTHLPHTQILASLLQSQPDDKPQSLSTEQSVYNTCGSGLDIVLMGARSITINVLFC